MMMNMAMSTSALPRNINDALGVWNSQIAGMNPSIVTVGLNPQTANSATPEAVVSSPGFFTSPVYMTIQPFNDFDDLTQTLRTVNEFVLSPDSVTRFTDPNQRRVIAYGLMDDLNTIRYSNAMCRAGATAPNLRGNCNLTSVPYDATWTRAVANSTLLQPGVNNNNNSMVTIAATSSSPVLSPQQQQQMIRSNMMMMNNANNAANPPMTMMMMPMTAAAANQPMAITSGNAGGAALPGNTVFVMATPNGTPNNPNAVNGAQLFTAAVDADYLAGNMNNSYANNMMYVPIANMRKGDCVRRTSLAQKTATLAGSANDSRIAWKSSDKAVVKVAKSKSNAKRSSTLCSRCRHPKCENPE
jgi:hypothetical protein